MLTIAEEFMLMALDSRTGDFRGIQTEYLHAGLVGASVMELALRGRIDSDVDRAWVVDAEPTGDASLDPVLAAMSKPGFPPQLERVIEQLMPLGEAVNEQILSRLCARGVLGRIEGRSVLFKKVTRYEVLDDRALTESRARLERLLRSGELPDPREVCLITLARTCGLLERILPASAVQPALDLLSKVSGMDLIGQNVRRYLYLFERDMAG
jgi:hypothetical protein